VKGGSVVIAGYKQQLITCSSVKEGIIALTCQLVFH
jgi:hypothetical protein